MEGLKVYAGITFILLSLLTDGIYTMPFLESGCVTPEYTGHGFFQLSHDNVRAIYECDPGYFLIGDIEITCINGAWSAPAPVCIATGCESLMALTDGYMTISYGGALARFRCEEGFVLKGSSAIMCDGEKWNATQPECLNPLEFKRRSDSSYLKSNSAHKHHKHHRGGEKRTHEEWLDVADYSCIGHDRVVAPPPILNAVPSTKWVKHEGFPRLYTVYRCKWGYERAGSRNKNLYCQDREWVGSKPKCVMSVTTTTEPYYLQADQPIGGSHEDWLLYADYTCFSHDQQVTAPDVAHANKIPSHVALQGSPHLYVQYTCAENFRLSGGSGYMYCRNHSWLGDKPRCERISDAAAADACGRNNGGCSQTCQTVNGQVKCGCRRGYSLSYDGRSCVDEDECAGNNGGCDQICMNTEGSFRCECKPGFFLTRDGRTCAHKSRRDEGGEIPPLVLFHS